MKQRKQFTSRLVSRIVALSMILSMFVVPGSAADVKEGRYTIVSALGNDLVLDLQGNNTDSGTPLTVYTSNGTGAQDFTLDHVEGDWFRIVHTESGKVVDVSGGIASVMVPIHLWDWNGSFAQLYRFISDGNGGWYIQNRLGFYLDVMSGVAEPGRQLWTWTLNKSAAQTWRLKSLDSGSSSAVTMYVRTSNPANSLRMRSAPSTNSSIVTNLSFGTAVTVYSISGGWANVSANGKTGYVSTQYLSEQNPYGGFVQPSGGLHAPVPDGAKFNRKTNDGSFYGYHDINRGISTSTPVYAIADGTAYFYQCNTGGLLRSYGNYIRFVSADGQYEVRYAHLSGFNGVPTPLTSSAAYPCSGCQDKTPVGTLQVSAGQTLGWIGKSGNASGVHLHIEVYRNGTRIDPTELFPNLI